jgi:hypothetical protein
MKIAVLHSSGNVGKSTITKELIYPRLENPLIVEVETVNDSNINNAALNITKYDVESEIENLYMQMLETENVIVDIGASNIQQFFTKVLDFEGFLTIFDYFVVPAVAGDMKITKDTIKTVTFLQSLGIEDEKIKVILNKVKSNPELEFDILLKNSPVAINSQNHIKNTKLFADLVLLKSDIKSVFNEDLDFYKSQILAAQTPQEKMRLIKMDMSNRLAHTVVKKFDDIFRDIFNQEPISLFSQAKEVKKETSKATKKEEKKEDVNIEDSEDF